MKKIVLIITTILLIGSLTSCFVANDVNTSKRENILAKYEYSNDANIYFDNEKYLAGSTQIVSTVYKNMPQHFVDYINSNWAIIVSEKEPVDYFAYNMTAAGVTYYEIEMIWLCYSFTNKTFAHECGHVIDKYLNDINQSDKFINLYKTYWNEYVEYGTARTSKHATSSSAEFFATLFADYILYPDYVNEKAPEVSTYFSTIFDKNWKPNKNNYFNFGNKEDVNRNNYISATQTTNNRVQNNEFLDTNQYQYKIDYSWASESARSVITIMLDLSINPENYPEDFVTFSENKGYHIHYDYEFEKYNYDEILSFASMYFGDENIDPVDISVNGNSTDVLIKHNIVLNAENKRQESLKNVNNVLKTFKDGHQLDLLIQVSDYILTNSSYTSDGNSSINDFWNRKCNNVIYAMIFKQFADRLSIQNDIIHVVYENGVSRIYNRVTINNTYYYFDLNKKMLASPITDDIACHLNTWKTD